MKKKLVLLASLILIFQLGACVSRPEEGASSGESSSEAAGENPETEEFGVIHETEFGGVYITITIDDFNDRYGFSYGDSVDVCLHRLRNRTM